MTPESQTQPKSAPRTKGCRMLAVASGKGGVGKTWFSITLAHTLAKRKVRSLLFDGDLGLANLDIQLGLMPKQDLGNVLTGRLTLSQAVVPYEEGGFDVIAGRSGSGGLANMATGRLQILGDALSSLAASYDKVIVDLGAGIERTVRQLTHSVDACLVIATNEPTSLTDAYAFIKITHMERPGANIKIVINMANSIAEGERTYNTLLKACEGFLKISPELLGIVRRDKKVADAIRHQVSIVTRSPNCEAVEDVGKIADKLMKL